MSRLFFRAAAVALLTSAVAPTAPMLGQQLPAPPTQVPPKETPPPATPPAAPLEVFRLTEHDDDGHTIKLTPDRKAVDLNSSLEFGLNKDDLAVLLREQQLNTDSEALTARLQTLRFLVEQEAAVLSALAKAQTSYQQLQAADKADYPTKLAAWQQDMSGLRYAGQILADPEALRLFEAAPEVIGWQQEYARVFSVGRELIARQTARLDSTVRQEGIYLQVGAWLLRKGAAEATPLRVPPFDDYPEQERFVVERWQYVLTPEQQAELARLEAQAKTANEEGVAALIKAKVSLKLVLDLAQQNLNPPVAKLLNDIKDAQDKLTRSTARVRTTVARLDERLRTAQTLLNQLATRYRVEQPATQPSAALLTQTNQDLSALVQQAQLVRLSLDSTRQVVRAEMQSLRSGDVFTALDGIAKQLEPVAQQLTQLTSVTEAGRLLQALFQGQTIANSALQFTDKVHKLSVSELPATAEFALASAGKRDQGDELVVKVAAGSRTQARRELQVRRLKLLHLLPFVRLAPALLFVDPLMHTPSDKAMFRVGASYSILYKGFWYKAADRRNNPGFFRQGGPGLGINIATLDFNYNGAPEIGAGLVVSALADFVQVGGGFNTVSGNPYYFFSFRLPTEVFTTP